MDAVLDDIKFNCDVSDARYWGYFSICGLLMRYRDLFRSEMGLEPWCPIAREEIATWIGCKESRWSGLENEDLRNLTIKGTDYSPFDIEGINKALYMDGYVYGAGYGMYLKPTFFLGHAQSVATIEGHTVHTTGREIVRDLFTAPAMLRERSIFLRFEPLKALLWEKYNELRPGRGPALTEAFRAYEITGGQPVSDVFVSRFEQMVLNYAGVLLRHELAESQETVPQWKELLTQAGDRNTEHFLRAVKDLVADTSDTGPFRSIVETRDRGALGLSVGLMDGYRKLLFPEVREAYGMFLENGSWDLIENARRRGYSRFLSLRQEIIELFTKSDESSFRRGLRNMMQGFA